MLSDVKTAFTCTPALNQSLSENSSSKQLVSLDVNFCKDHRDKIEVPDPLAIEDLISSKLNNQRKLARLITQYRDIFSSISEGTAFLLQGVPENDSSFERYQFKIWEIRYNK